MKLKYAYSFQEYDDKYLAIVDFLENDNDKRLLWVNECGKTIMELLQKDMTKEEIICALNKKYSGDAGVIEATTDAFVKQLYVEGLLE